jgi:hypothetical protein
MARNRKIFPRATAFTSSDILSMPIMESIEIEFPGNAAPGQELWIE